MLRDAQATRNRLVDAAIAEFAARGLAGGRVDRVAAAAAANKRAIYDYFTNKEGLFDAAVDRVIGRLNAAVTLDESDLPGYAGRLFDYLRAHPEAVRMITWRRLERPDTGSHLSPGFVARVAAIRDARTTGGGSREITPVDILILVIGLANAWDLSAADLLPAVGEDPGDQDRIAAHRSAVVEAARRLSASTA